MQIVKNDSNNVIVGVILFLYIKQKAQSEIFGFM